MTEDVASIGQPVPPMLFLYECARMLSRILVRTALTGRRRDEWAVAREYDQGRWSAMLRQRAWEAAEDLETFLIGTDWSPIVCKVGGVVRRMPRREYYRLRLEALERLMQEYVGAGPLVELGCGFGLNLFSLALRGPWRPLTGLDISPAAIAVGRAIADHFGLKHVTFDLIDLAAGDHPGFAAISGKTVFTYFCIEQVPRRVGLVLENILAARPRRVIHIESAVGLLDPWRPLDWLNYLYVWSADYQRELRAVVAALRARGALDVLADRRLGFAPTICNDGSVIVWEPLR